MMITGTTSSCYPNGTQGLPLYGVPHHQEVVSSSLDLNPSVSSTNHASSFLYNLSALKDKIHQAHSLGSLFLTSDHGQLPESTAIALPTMGTLIQEIIVTASSMMYSCQQMAHGGAPPPASPITDELHHQQTVMIDGSGGDCVDHQGFYSNDTVLDWYGANYNSNSTDTPKKSIAVTSNRTEVFEKETPQKTENNEEIVGLLPNNCDIIELDAADLLAKYTHYCQVCGKGFKRDANLRMHMRAHGDEYKSSAALINPMKRKGYSSGADELFNKLPRKYSCPHQGCRWNKSHKKFRPLKSMICVKNHYKRSHCPKMYVCKRCNSKQFSVLSDLRTHEKHCGDQKWQCSCGTTFSRKDKLMGHVALFVGHTPAINSLSRLGNGAQNKID